MSGMGEGRFEGRVRQLRDKGRGCLSDIRSVLLSSNDFEGASFNSDRL